MGSQGYTHHYARVRMGADGHDTDLIIMESELESVLSFLEYIDIGLKVLGVNNEKINTWIDVSKSHVAENIGILNSLIDKLDALPRLDEADYYFIVGIPHGKTEGVNLARRVDANKAIEYALNLADDLEASAYSELRVCENLGGNVIWVSGSPIPKYTKPIVNGVQGG